MFMEGLEIREIWKSFEKTSVLEGISFSQPKGEILGILGPSGSGKTTLLEIIAGLISPDRGDCLWNGVSVLDTPTHQRKFGLMFQEYVLFPHKNVRENIAFGLKMSGMGKSEKNSRVDQIMDLVGLPGFQERDISTLSGGEQQRVALARSLAPEPRLVMLDEPLGALDRTIRERLVGDLREILKNASQTALYVTHDQEEAFTIADRIVILGDQKIAQVGTARELYFQPNSPYVAKFLGMTNFLDGTARPVKDGSEIRTELGTWVITKPFQGQGKVLIRPDMIHLNIDEKKSETMLTGRLISSTFSGVSHQIRVQVKDLNLRFYLANQEIDLPSPGESITIGFKPEETIHFFPSD
jgi:ABC-type Fe3+/spermidine/putrescine transport system ATPase subunit